MTVYINARFLTQPLSGVQRYARELVTAFDRRLVQDACLRAELGPVVAVCPADAEIPDPGWAYIQRRIVRGGKGHIWEQGTLWRASRDGVLVCLGNSGPVMHANMVLAVHDANIYEIPLAFTRRYRLVHKVLRPVLARRAARLITVSRHSAQTLAGHLGIGPSQFSIVPNAAGHIAAQIPDPDAFNRRGLTRGGYWLSLGNNSPNKNIARLVAAHSVAGQTVPPLVVVGGAVSGLAQEKAVPGTRVHWLGRVDDGELRALFDGAAGFLFAPLSEGFGIPPVEAMQLGVPVLASRRGALPEVLGDAAMWFDPLSVSDMAARMKEFSALSGTARADMIAAGRKQASEYSWKASADRLILSIRSANIDARLGADGTGLFAQAEY